jgi:hypothetical protein
MTAAEYEARRLALCHTLSLDSQKDIDELIDELRSHAEATKPLSRDRFALGFLTSFREFGSDYIRDPRRLDWCDYQHRTEIMTHRESDQASPNPYLVREIEIGFPTASLSPDLELLNSPGLETPLPSSDPLAGLDGAFLFLRADLLHDASVHDLASRLRHQFGDLTGRVWLVVTGFDRVEPAALEGGPKESTIFDTLGQVANSYGLPLGQVLLIGNHLHRQLAASPDQSDREQWYRQLGLEVKDGQPILPELLLRHEMVRESYLSFLRDGGIGALRTATERLAQMLKVRLSVAATTEMRKLAKDLLELLLVARQRAGMALEDLRNAFHWETAVHALIDRLNDRHYLIEELGRSLRAKLQAYFKQIQPGRERDPEELARGHRLVGILLSAQATQLVRQETLPALYQGIQNALGEMAQAADLRPVRLPSGLSPVEAVAEGRAEHPGDYLAGFESLREENLFPSHDSQPFLTSAQYRRIIERKLDVVVYEAMHMMAHRLTQRLHELTRQLSLLGRDAPVDTVENDLAGLLQAAQEV